MTTDPLRQKLQAMHRRAQKAEGKLARTASMVQAVVNAFRAGRDPNNMWAVRHLMAALSHARQASGAYFAAIWTWQRAELDKRDARIAELEARERNATEEANGVGHERAIWKERAEAAEAKVGELTRERDDFQACALSWAEKASHTFAIKASLAAAEARVAELTAERDEAVKVERERCALIADPPLAHRKGKVGLWRQRRAIIAAAIRKGATP